MSSTPCHGGRLHTPIFDNQRSPHRKSFRCSKVRVGLEPQRRSPLLRLRKHRHGAGTPDAATGDSLWGFAGDGALASAPVVAAGYVYVASQSHVFAVRIADHKEAWKADDGGTLYVAAGRLFVARSDGTLAAYRMSR
jgi:hypothetical protein